MIPEHQHGQRFWDVEQGSSDWFDLRKGIPTASRFKQILTPTGKLSESCRKLICELVSERYSLIPPEGAEQYTNRHIRWGQMTEEEARRYYCVDRAVQVSNGGFHLSACGRFGASPDANVGTDGLLEIKCLSGEQHVEDLLDGDLPARFRPQIHGHLLVTGRQWCDYLAYSPGLPPLLVRVVPDDYTEKLRAALEAFYAKFQAALTRFQPVDTSELSPF